MIIFLDVDGVLRPWPAEGVVAFHRFDLCGNGPLQFVSVLEAALEPYPAARIVISSNWRRYIELRDFREPLGSLFARVIGTTDPSPLHCRYAEIRAWADQNRVPNWLAIDDDSRGWAEEDRDRLVLCEESQGLGSSVVERELAEKLALFSSFPHSTP